MILTSFAALAALVVYGTGGMLLSTIGASRLDSGAARGCEYAFGLMFGLIGGKSLLDGLQELKR